MAYYVGRVNGSNMKIEDLAHEIGLSLPVHVVSMTSRTRSGKLVRLKAFEAVELTERQVVKLVNSEKFCGHYSVFKREKGEGKIVELVNKKDFKHSVGKKLSDQIKGYFNNLRSRQRSQKGLGIRGC